MSKITPHLVSVWVTGADGLARFAAAAPTSHIKVFLPAPGQSAPTMPIATPEGRIWPDGLPRPTVRTYTPRAFDPDKGALEVQFVLHGAGPASEWAERVGVGDRLAIGGPGGRFSLDLQAGHWWIAADESALPAVGTLLDALPSSAAADVHIEVNGSEDEVALTSAADLNLVWHHRQGDGGFGEAIFAAAQEATMKEGSQVWVACEASAVRRVRRVMLEQKTIPNGALVTRGYWRLGSADHPDHDHGED